jgi:malate synthase
VDAELAVQAGPQLVVPILNARYALNAANARWGSLYDALYGTDVIAETRGLEKGKGYNPRRGAKVIEWAPCWTAGPLKGSHVDSTGYRQGRQAGRQAAGAASGRRCWSRRSSSATRATPRRRRRCCWCTTACTSTSASTAPRPSARPTRPAADLVVEAALSTILDLEDSVAAVDAEDKVLGYRNWLGILRAR